MLTSTVSNVATLNSKTTHSMYELYDRYYRATSQERFEQDLGSKDTILLLNDENGNLCGFTTIAVVEMEADGIPARVVFSGDTVIDKAHWGSQTFAYSWIRQIGRIAAEAPEKSLYWLLIAKGHRTYRYLPAFGINFVPDWRRPKCRRLDTIKDTIARQMFGSYYDRKRGIVEFPDARGHLAPEWAGITEREAQRPDVRYFLDRNPGYVKGDELVCLCELSEANMKPLARRLFRQGFSS